MEDWCLMKFLKRLSFRLAQLCSAAAFSVLVGFLTSLATQQQTLAIWALSFTGNVGIVSQLFSRGIVLVGHLTHITTGAPCAFHVNSKNAKASLKIHDVCAHYAFAHVRTVCSLT